MFKRRGLVKKREESLTNYKKKKQTGKIYSKNKLKILNIYYLI